MSGRDARSRTRRIVSLLTLTLLILRAQDAFSGADVPRVEADDDGNAPIVHEGALLPRSLLFGGKH